jgi:hypothetical protein
LRIAKHIYFFAAITKTTAAPKITASVTGDCVRLPTKDEIESLTLPGVPLATGGAYT